MIINKKNASIRSRRPTSGNMPQSATGDKERAAAATLSFKYYLCNNVMTHRTNTRKRQLLTVSVLVTIMLYVTLFDPVKKRYLRHPLSRTPKLSDFHVSIPITYRPSFEHMTQEAFLGKCHAQIHTYQIKDGKVRWTPSPYSYLTRGISVHCLLARAAKRLGAPFETSIRISLADLELKSTAAFGPAADMEQMKSKTFPPPLLFPDSTWESWPEVHDYSLPQTAKRVKDAATAYGLPGTTEWFERRKTKLVWRGSSHGSERLELIHNISSPLLDIQATGYNLTNMGLRLSSNNQISRQEHCGYKFLLHMNGIFNNRYSSAIKWKLLCGSLVFVPVKPLFVEWWNYRVWEPYVHYVPFNSATDLLEKVEYYAKHLDEAAEIAARGMQLAESAVGSLDSWLDTTLRRYAEETKHLAQPSCGNATNRYYKTLEELQKEYGPTLCA